MGQGLGLVLEPESGQRALEELQQTLHQRGPGGMPRADVAFVVLSGTLAAGSWWSFLPLSVVGALVGEGIGGGALGSASILGSGRGTVREGLQNFKCKVGPLHLGAPEVLILPQRRPS